MTSAPVARAAPSNIMRGSKANSVPIRLEGLISPDSSWEGGVFFFFGAVLDDVDTGAFFSLTASMVAGLHIIFFI